MKVDAPEKIYLTKNLLGELFDGWDALPSNDFISIEYTRTDAFIEKACSWLSNMSIEDMEYKYDGFDTSEGWYRMIEEFKNYMKGE